MNTTAETPIASQSDAVMEAVDADGCAAFPIDAMPEAEYRARREWSVSQFKLLPEEPELFHGRHIAKLPDYQMQPSAAMQVGTVLHEALLQGIEPRIIPASVLSSSSARQGTKWKDFANEHAGEIWLKESEAEPIKRAIESVRNDKKARTLLELPGNNELSLFWRDEYTGLRLRCRLDSLKRVGNGIVIDLKSATDPTEIGFPYACLDHKYHVQAATYMDAVEQYLGNPPESFVFIAVQVAPPYICQVYTCVQEMLDLGFTRMREALGDLKERLETNDWHRAGHNNINRLNLPKKAYQQY